MYVRVLYGCSLQKYNTELTEFANFEYLWDQEPSLHIFVIFRLGMPLTIPDETLEKGNAKRLQIISLLH